MGNCRQGCKVKSGAPCKGGCKGKNNRMGCSVPQGRPCKGQTPAKHSKPATAKKPAAAKPPVKPKPTLNAFRPIQRPTPNIDSQNIFGNLNVRMTRSGRKY